MPAADPVALPFRSTALHGQHDGLQTEFASFKNSTTGAESEVAAFKQQIAELEAKIDSASAQARSLSEANEASQAELAVRQPFLHSA